MESGRWMYFVVRGALHPFDAPGYPGVQIVGWSWAGSPRDAIRDVLGRIEGEHTYYSAFKFEPLAEAMNLPVRVDGVATGEFELVWDPEHPGIA